MIILKLKLLIKKRDVIETSKEAFCSLVKHNLRDHKYHLFIQKNDKMI